MRAVQRSKQASEMRKSAKVEAKLETYGIQVSDDANGDVRAIPPAPIGVHPDTWASRLLDAQHNVDSRGFSFLLPEPARRSRVPNALARKGCRRASHDALVVEVALHVVALHGRFKEVHRTTSRWRDAAALLRAFAEGPQLPSLRMLASPLIEGAAPPPEVAGSLIGILQRAPGVEMLDLRTLLAADVARVATEAPRAVLHGLRSVSTRRNVHALLEAAPHVHRASATSADFCREGVELPALAHLQLNGFLRGPALDVVARRCPNLEVLFADLSDADAPKMTEDLPIRALIDERPRPVPCREQLMDVLAHAPRLEHLSVRTMAHEAPLSFEALPVLPALREIEALPGPVDGPGLRALLERAPSLEQLTITLPASFVSDSLADALEGVRAPARLANVVVHVQRGTAMSARDHQALEALAPKRLVARAA